MIDRFEEDYTSEKIKNWICQNSDPKYQKFASSLLPGITNVKGVKRPIIQQFAAQIAKGNWQSYLKIAGDDSFEEIMLHGLVIALIKETALEKQQKLEQFIGKINNWSVCDSLCANIKQVKAERWKWWPWVKKYADSDDEFTVRFGVVMILSHFIAEDYLDEIFEVLNKKHFSGYYAQMAVGWAIAEIYAHFPVQTEKFLENNLLEKEVQNKAIRKICESLKISSCDKERVRKLKK